MLKESKISDYTPQLSEKIKSNADELIYLGFKAWKKKRKMKGLTKDSIMTELEQDEALRRIEENTLEGKDG